MISYTLINIAASNTVIGDVWSRIEYLIF